MMAATRYDYMANQKLVEERGRITSPIRWEKVIEGRAIVGEIPYGSPFEKTVYLFSDKQRIEDGLSYKEIALILYPEDTWDGGKTPSWYAVARVRGLLKDFRKSNDNAGLVLFCGIYEEKKYFLVYSIQNKKEFKPIETRLMRISNGVAQTIVDALHTLGLPARERNRMLQSVLQELKIEAVKKITTQTVERKKKRR